MSSVDDDVAPTHTDSKQHKLTMASLKIYRGSAFPPMPSKPRTKGKSREGRERSLVRS
ncbi:hypothetical protein FRC04_005123 [Tulasnella sp. 424]|nr:hypothetical protein FRC04_005123 [Tulasnella sp. 424]